MPLHEKLLAILVCPRCRGDLRYDQEAERLICEVCRLRFVVREDGVPVMLLEEAETFDRP
jgi:uncharacterized protein